jgi:ABC-type multidrug transport system fused ATPase/permease subunit
MLLTSLIRQKPYEHIELKVRRNLLTLIPAIIGALVLYLLPVAVAWLLLHAFPNFIELPVLYPLSIMAGSLFYLFSILLFVTYFVDFYLDLLIVTNDRLIRISQHGLFSRTIFEVDLYQIQDATSEISGAVQSLFKFGSVTIEAVGSEPKRVAENVSHPEKLRARILELAENDKKFHLKTI